MNMEGLISHVNQAFPILKKQVETLIFSQVFERRRADSTNSQTHSMTHA